jgi:hypothetical protein
MREGEIDDAVANEMKETYIILTSNDIIGLLAVAMILRLALDKLQSAVAVVAVGALAFYSYSFNLLQNFKLFITNVITI